MEELKKSLDEYIGQLSMITAAIQSTENGEEKESLVTLQSELQELIHLTQENLDAISEKETSNECAVAKENIDDEYARFMQEMAKSGAYEDTDKNPEVPGSSKDSSQEDDGSDIEEDLSSLLGMKCAVYHTHKWGGVPSLHNAMVSTIVPRQDDDQFKDLQVQILFTHPTHAEMLPCPFYLNGECRFTDEQCRYSHGDVTLLSDLKDAMEPNFELVKVGSRILIKLKPPDDEDISLKKKSAEKYHLWHRAIVKTVDFDNRSCVVKLESGVKSGEKRKIGSDEVHCTFEEIYPLNAEVDTDTSSDDSVSDTEYPESKTVRPVSDDSGALLAESLPHAGPAMGEWERHTRGIGSKLMLAMGYVPGRGLGAAGEGRVLPVEARVLPVGKSLDHCMAITEANGQDPLKVEQRLRRLQKKEEERNKRAYEREQERERRNVFNFLNKTLGDKTDNPESSNVGTSKHIKQSTNKDLNIEKFKIAEDTRKVEREITKLNSSLARSSPGSELHRNINIQIGEKNKELNQLRSKEQQITKEQSQRKNKQNMVF